MATYNKYKPISIGGTSNVIPASGYNVSLNVTGNTYNSQSMIVGGDIKMSGNFLDMSGNNIIASLNSRLVVDETNITSLYTLTSTHTSQVTSLNTRLTADELIATGLTTTTVLQTSQIGSIGTRIGLSETNITSNIASIASLNGRITTDEINITSNIASIASLNTRITTDETSITGLLSATTNQTYASSLTTFNDNLAVNGYVKYVDNTTQITATPNIPIGYFSNNWSLTSGTGSNAYASCSMSSNGKYQTILLTSGTVYTSTNYGVTLNNVSNLSGITFQSTKMSASGQYQYICALTGFLYYSVDYGVTFNQTATSLQWRSITCSASGQYVLAGERSSSYLWLSSNYGVTFSQVSGMGGIFYAVAISTLGQYMLAVQGGFAYVSSNFGSSFTQVYTNASYAFRACAISSTGQYMSIASANGSTSNSVILRSSNYGTTWATVSGTTNINWNVLQMTSNGEYQLAGAGGNASGGIYYSTDFGVTFTAVTTTGTTNLLYTFCAMSANGQYITLTSTTGIFTSNYFMLGSTDLVSINSRLVTDETNITNTLASVVSLNTRCTADELNITNTLASVVSLNTRCTADELNITNTLASVVSLNTRCTADELNITNTLASVVSLNTRCTADELNITNTLASIVSINTRITSDETNIATKTTLTAVQANNNAWTGTNSFNSSIPTTTLTPTLASQFITKTYGDSTYTTSGNVVGANNAWTGTNSFNTSLPTSTQTPTTSTQLITKAYSDGVTSGLSTSITTANTNISTLQTNTQTISYDASNSTEIQVIGSYYTLPTVNTGYTVGMRIGFNGGYATETDYHSMGGGGTGGHYWYISNYALVPTLYMTLTPNLLNIASTVVTLFNGNISANSNIITPTQLGYISGLTSNCQTQLSTLQTQCNRISYASYTTTINNGVSFPSLPNALPTTNSGTQYGLSLYWNNSGGTGEVDYLSMGQGGTGGHYFYCSSTTTAPVLYMALTTTSLTFNSAIVTTFNGNLSANGNTITPTQLGYISGLTSNAQTQISTNATNIASNTSSITTLNGQMTTANTNISSNTSAITTIQTITNNMSYSSAGTGAIFINTGNTTVNALNVSNKLYSTVSQNLSGSSTITFPLREFYNCGTSSGTLTLPTPATANDGAHCTFYKTSLTNTITLSSGSSNMFAYGSITAVSSLSFTGNTTTMTLYTNGTNWYELVNSLGIPESTITYNNISGAVTFTGGLNLGGDITSTSGNFINSTGYYYGSIKARQGSAGGTAGNSINSWWTGSVLQSWVDTTNIGNFTISDYRVKENINYNVASVLDRLCTIPMFEYTIKDISIFSPNGNHIGCFADQVQSTFTEYPNVVQGTKDAVQENGDIAPQSITPELVYILMKSIQELNAKVTDLQNQINALKN